LRAAWAACGITGPIVFVGHSYGGGIVVVAAWGKGELDKNLAVMRAQFDDIRAQAPALAKVAIPWAEALPATVKRIDDARVAEALPITDIVAEHGQNSSEATQVWRDAHTAFTAGHPARAFVLATGSSHKIMADQPALVVDAITKMIAKIQVK
jgi:pimeloyl-ACP methyl ester carboxylesterase